MKHYALLLVLLVALSCSTRKEYNAEEFQQIQLDYEKEKIAYSKLKMEANLDKEKLFNENKPLLISLIQLVDQLRDTATSFENVHADTTFFMENVIMKPMNFGIAAGYRTRTEDTDQTSKTSIAKVIFLAKGLSKSSDSFFRGYLDELESCVMTQNDAQCLEIQSDKLQSILDLKYAFIVKELLRIQPEIKKKEFSGGIYMANVVCYDLDTRNPLFTFLATAESSDEISYGGTFGKSADETVKRDFESNIQKGILRACKKHFEFVEDIHFIGRF